MKNLLPGLNKNILGNSVKLFCKYLRIDTCTRKTNILLSYATTSVGSQVHVNLIDEGKKYDDQAYSFTKSGFWRFRGLNLRFRSYKRSIPVLLRPMLCDWFFFFPQCEECGGGESVREVRCVDIYDSSIPGNYCTEAKPPTTKSCDTKPCTVDWWLSDWTPEVMEYSTFKTATTQNIKFGI